MVEFTPDQEKFLRYECSNNHCFYATSDRFNLFRHEAVCRSSTLINYKQLALTKPDDTARKALELEGIIPNDTWQNWHFACYDIECFTDHSQDPFQAYGVHRLVSIAIKSSFGSEAFIVRKNMTPDSLRPMLENFRLFLVNLREEMLDELPDSVIKGLKKYQEIVWDESFKSLPVAEQTACRAKLRYLTDCLKLRIYSWNGERYDNNVIFAPLMDILQYQQGDFSRMNIIRRGTGIMEFSFGNLVFRDFLNFSCPIKLEAFAKSCGLAEKAKTAFPYELYKDISDLKSVQEFPAYPLFYSSLPKETDGYAEELIKLVNCNISSGIWKNASDVQEFFEFSPDLVLEFENDRLVKVTVRDGSELSEVLHTCPKMFFESKCFFRQTCGTMLDYLEAYNKNDVIILDECIKVYAKGIYDTWKVNIHQFMSLPGVAQGLLTNHN